MGFFFWRKEEKIIDKIKTLLEAIDKTRDIFYLCITSQINDGPNLKNKEAAERVHDAESRVDDIRREIELELYKKALIPESRGDVLGILEAVDLIPNRFQRICYQMSLEKVLIPEAFKEKMIRLVDINLETYPLLREEIIDLFYNKDSQERVDKIDEWESKSDRLERDLIDIIFDTDLSKADKMQLRDVILSIGKISNVAQDTTSRLMLAVVKRRM